MASAEGDMTRQGFTATQALEQMVASEDEGPEEDVSEEEDGEEYDPEHDDDAVDDEEAPGVADAAADDDRPGDRRADGEIYLSKNVKIAWSSVPCRARQGSPPRGRHEAVAGPTAQAAAGACDIASAFSLFITPRVEAIVLEATNREGSRRHGDAWRGMDAVDLRAYAGLLILAGVYRSRGEAAASLWDAESGRPIFRATMTLKVFYAYSSLLRFDDRETRPARRAIDKLAAVRELWDEWSARLPSLYNPGPDVTVDEQLVPFRGRCPFRQYMPSKPARYGIKAWVCCDARSSYAWKMQVYTGKTRDGPEKNLGARVVFDLTEGLPRDHTVTCDNFFTSYKLAQRLLADRGLALVGTVRKNKPELPPALLATKTRRVLSSAFAFTPIATLVSYLARRNRNVLLLSTLHADARLSDRADRKPALILDYNRNKGGVDNLDKVIGTYSCRRMTARWPLAVFHNILDVSSYNAFVIWLEVHPDWMPGKRNKRRVFLERLGKALVRPLIERRVTLPRTEASAAVVRAAREEALCGTPPDDGLDPDALGPRAPAPEAPAPDNRASKRKRCQMCPSKKDRKTHTVCGRCNKYICKDCSRAYCTACANWGFVRGGTI
ncbi:hypothetical protein DPEC_G00260590 [Dallia pectoralis]|uniref:Uncharacterized protein n=1 Tax=Dallia pectoralis TaxID=75939 RepID=A0ACC2FRE7_DALPE|nr:hypothetical protein DPEC_G00260590 [Dallia pectoralis]